MQRKIEVVIYSKPGCHLCEEMKTEIARANCSDLYLLKEINIETDPLLRERQMTSGHHPSGVAGPEGAVCATFSS